MSIDWSDQTDPSPSPSTARVVKALEGALWSAGHNVKVPGVLGLDWLAEHCDLLGIKPSELVAAVERTDCPPWCSPAGHPVHDPAHHIGEIHTGGGVTVTLCQGLGEGVRIYAPDTDDGLTVDRARAIGAALTMAARMVDEGGQS